MNRTAAHDGDEYRQLSFDFYSLRCPEMSAVEAIRLFDDTKHCKECGGRVFDMYLRKTGEIGISIKCMHCNEIVDIPILLLSKGN